MNDIDYTLFDIFIIKKKKKLYVFWLEIFCVAQLPASELAVA